MNNKIVLKSKKGLKSYFNSDKTKLHLTNYCKAFPLTILTGIITGFILVKSATIGVFFLILLGISTGFITKFINNEASFSSGLMSTSTSFFIAEYTVSNMLHQNFLNYFLATDLWLWRICEIVLVLLGTKWAFTLPWPRRVIRIGRRNRFNLFTETIRIASNPEKLILKPKKKVKVTSGAVESTICNICGTSTDENLMVCRICHSEFTPFHPSCFVDISNSTCPICRAHYTL